MLENTFTTTPTTTTTSSELFKSNFIENNENWNQHTFNDDDTTFSSSPSSFEYPFTSFDDNNEEENKETNITKNNRVHLRHFSANDSHCIRNNTTYSPSSSPPFLLQQQQQNLSPLNNALNELDQKQQRRLRFDIVLEAATAVTQKAEESAITYLNRGQVYGIQLNDKQATNELITSTLSIAFHSSSHRRIAESYWKFWISQQKQTNARAIDIDASQSTGISDLNFPSFDKITFSWNGSYGAKIFVRFKCLSTDFSRIKGVKGIPLRTQMESYVNKEKEEEKKEICFCKVKLFRDKGAERKNKDDAKQISKQLEKVYGKANEQSLPLMYNVSLPYSVFGEIPTSTTLDSFEHATDDLSIHIKTPARYHTRVMTAPNLFYNTKIKSSKGKKSTVLPPFATTATTTTTTSTSTSPITSTITTKKNYDFQNYLTQQQQALASLPPHIDTSLESPLSIHQHLNTPFDDDLPPLTSDASLPTPHTAQATPIDFTHHHHQALFLTTPDLMTDIYQQQTTSIYDIFTPEEIQQPPEECSITPTKEDFFGHSITTTSPNYLEQKDYFCSMATTTPSNNNNNNNNNSITLLQQQLQLHNETASNIILNNNTVSNMLLLSPPPTTSATTHQDGNNKRKKRRQHHPVNERILTYSSNPSHLTLSSSNNNNDCNSNSNSSSNMDSYIPLKKLRYHNL